MIFSQLKLRTLDVGNNMIEEIENISHLSKLEEFWVSHSWISDRTACAMLIPCTFLGELQPDPVAQSSRRATRTA